MSEQGRLHGENIKGYLFAGKAIVTVESSKTGSRYTYKITNKEDKIFFISLLTSPDCYEYVAYTKDKKSVLTSKKSKMTSESLPVKVIQFVLKNIDNIPDSLHIYHEGRCGACGRRLTVPESIKSGIGPECGRRASKKKLNSKVFEEVKNKEAKEESSKDTKEKVEVHVISVIEKGKLLNINFKKHYEIIEAVKACTYYRKYNPETTSWDISKHDVPGLINRLKDIPYINYSELVEYSTLKKSDLKEMSRSEFIPMEHQIEAAKFLLKEEKAILADDMGVGKTLSAIIAGYNIEGRKLIVCPATLQLNWKKEILKVDNNQKVSLINESLECNWLIVSYNMLKKIESERFDCVIVDEAHYIKSVNNFGKATAGRGKQTLDIAKKTKYVFLLTGTPITNKTKDIFNLLKAVESPFSRNFMSFAKRYCGAFRMEFGWDTTGSSNTKELHEKLKGVMLRRTKEEILDLPEKIRSFIPVEINKREYTKMFKEYMEVRKNLNGAAQLVELNALRHLLAIKKVDSTLEQINNLLEQNKQVVVFTCYQAVVEKIVSLTGASTITGSDSITKKQKAVDDFQKGDIRVLVCNIVAGGTGITLTSTEHIIFNDFDWTPSNHLQAEDRAHRKGQTKKCNIIYMYAGNTEIDTMISELIENKLNNINKIIDNKEASIFNKLLKRLA